MKRLLFAGLILLMLCSSVRAYSYFTPQASEDKVGVVFGGLLNLGLAYWGFKQENGFGNVAGSIFALKGCFTILEVKF